MKFVYFTGLALWALVLCYCILKVPIDKGPQLKIHLNTPTPIVMTGELIVTDSNGDIQVILVKAGDTLVIRSEP